MNENKDIKPMKVCSKCKEEKSLDEFSNNKKGKFGKCSICKSCDHNRKRKKYDPIISGNIICTMCGQEKSPSEFPNASHKRNGKRSNCKSCEVYHTTPSQYFKRNLSFGNKRIAKIKDINSLSNYLGLLYEKSNKCELTGLPMIINGDRNKKYHRYPDSPSVDRIDNTKGYDIDNIRLVSLSMNIALNEWGEDVFKENAIAYLEKHGFRVTKDDELD